MYNMKMPLKNTQISTPTTDHSFRLFLHKAYHTQSMQGSTGCCVQIITAWNTKSTNYADMR